MKFPLTKLLKAVDNSRKSPPISAWRCFAIAPGCLLRWERMKKESSLARRRVSAWWARASGVIAVLAGEDEVVPFVGAVLALRDQMVLGRWMGGVEGEAAVVADQGEPLFLVGLDEFLGFHRWNIIRPKPAEEAGPISPIPDDPGPPSVRGWGRSCRARFDARRRDRRPFYRPRSAFRRAGICS